MIRSDRHCGRICARARQLAARMGDKEVVVDPTELEHLEKIAALLNDAERQVRQASYAPSAGANTCEGTHTIGAAV